MVTVMIWNMLHAGRYLSVQHTVCLVFVGILEVLHCVLVESPEALNIIKEGHIKSIISLLDKHGRNHKVHTSTLLFIRYMWC